MKRPGTMDDRKADDRNRRPESEEDRQHRTTVNLLGAIAALVIVIVGVWLLINLQQAVKSEECLMFGLKSCARIDGR